MNEIFNSLMVFTDVFMVLNDGQTQEWWMIMSRVIWKMGSFTNPKESFGMGLSTHSAKNLPFFLQGIWLIGHGFWYVFIVLGRLGTAKKGIRMVLSSWLSWNEGYEDEIWLTMWSACDKYRSIMINFVVFLHLFWNLTMKGEDNLKVGNLQVEPSEFIAVSFAPLHVWTCLFCRSLGRVLHIKSMCPKIGCTPRMTICYIITFLGTLFNPLVI